MINEENAKKYCADDISLIENYSKAVASPEKWVCHHRGEILPCGRYSCKTLKKFGLYWNRPANELIFITDTEHKSMHNSGKNHPMYGKHHTDAAKEKCRQASLGKHHTEETKEKMSHSRLGKHHSETTKEKIRQSKLGEKNPLYGKRHTDETKEKMSQKWLGMKWFNNGSVCVRARECPPGFTPGRLSWRRAAS